MLPWLGRLRALGEILQERVCFSHNLQRRLRPRQALLSQRQLAAKPGELGLVLAWPPEPGPGLLTGEHPGITQLAPLGDLGGVQTLPAQIRPTTALGARRLVSGQVVDFLRRGERPPPRRTTGSWLGSIHPTIVSYGRQS